MPGASPSATREEHQIIRHAVVRLRAGILAIVFGMLGGSGLAVATLWLVLRGGQRVGAHLGLLRFYFPGYSVSWPGVVVGFLYGALTGALVGWAVATIYGRIATWRQERSRPTL